MATSSTTNSPDRFSTLYRVALAACFLARCFFTARALQADLLSALPTASASVGPVPIGQPTDEPQLVTANIEDVRLGQRVVGTNPLREQTQPASDIDPATWRAVRLTMFEYGVQYDLAFLRPLTWIEATGAKVGGSIHMELHEMGLNGPAEIIAIDPCPEIEPDDGTGRNVVTGTMAHPGPNILYLDITGLDEPLGVTDTHPIWSETRQDFVVAGQLEVGEQFRTLNGERATLTKIQPHRGPPEMVFNLEVDGEHVYSVASQGLLVHNDCFGRDEILDFHRSEPASSMGDLTELRQMLADGDPRFFAEPFEAIVQDGKTIVVDGHHRLSVIADTPDFVDRIPIQFRDDIRDVLGTFGTFGN